MSKGPYVSPSTGARKLGSSSTTRSPNVSNVFSRMASKLSYNSSNQQHHRLKKYSSDDDWDDNKYAPREVSEHFKRYELMTEFINLKNSNHCPLGLYIMPSSENFNVWYGVLFVHKGYYSSGVFKFRVVISESYPEYPPSVTFMSDMFHPLIDGGGNLTICQQFLTWRPEESYIIHVLHYIKNIFKRAILDRLVDKICLNKDAYKLYRTDRNTFMKLARQCADLTITESYLFDHFPDDNLIRLSPMNDVKFADIRSQILPNQSSLQKLDIKSSYLDEEKEASNEASFYEKLLDKAEEMTFNEQRGEEEGREKAFEEQENVTMMEIQVINKVENENSNGDPLVVEVTGLVVNEGASKLISEEKEHAEAIIQVDSLEEDVKGKKRDRDGIIESTLKPIAQDINEKINHTNHEEALQKEMPLDNKRLKSKNTNQMDDDQIDIKQEDTKHGEYKQNNGIQENAIMKETGHKLDQRENIEQESPVYEDLSQTKTEQEGSEKEKTIQAFTKQEETGKEETTPEEFKQKNIKLDDEIIKDIKEEEGDEEDKKEIKACMKIVSEEIISEETMTEDITSKEIIGQPDEANNTTEHEYNQNDNKTTDNTFDKQIEKEVQDKAPQFQSDIQDKRHIIQEQDEIQKEDEEMQEVDSKPEEIIKVEAEQENIMIGEPDHKESENEHSKQDQPDLKKINNEESNQYTVKIEAKEKSSLDGNEEFKKDYYKDKENISDIKRHSVEETTEEATINIDTEKKKEGESKSQDEEPKFDTENNTSDFQPDTIQNHSGNSSNSAIDKNSIDEANSTNSNVKYQNHDDIIT